MCLFSTSYLVQTFSVVPISYPKLCCPCTLLRAFPNLGSAHQVFNPHVLCASSIFTHFSLCLFLFTSLHFSFGLPALRCPLTAIFHLLIATWSSLFFSPHDLTISVSLLLFSHICLPHLPWLLFLHSWSSQSSLLPSSISTFSFLFFLARFA